MNWGKGSYSMYSRLETGVLAFGFEGSEGVVAVVGVFGAGVVLLAVPFVVVAAASLASFLGVSAPFSEPPFPESEPVPVLVAAPPTVPGVEFADVV